MERGLGLLTLFVQCCSSGMIFFGSGSDFPDGFGSYMNFLTSIDLCEIVSLSCKCVRLLITTRYKIKTLGNVL